MKKEDLFEKLKRNTHVRCDMPDMNMFARWWLQLAVRLQCWQMAKA